MKSVTAREYAGKRVRLSGIVSTEDAESWVGLWMRVGGADDKVLGFDNMQRRPIKGTTEQQRYDIVLDVPQEGTGLSFGLMLMGKGKAWVGNLRLETVGEEIKVTGGAVDIEADPEVEAQIEAGCLLVATRELTDEYFAETIILLSHHDLTERRDSLSIVRSVTRISV